MFYSHDGFGLGHTRRHLAVASALGQLDPSASILLATGADYVARLGVPRQVEVLKLPSLRKLANEEYGSRHLRIPGDDIRALRSALLLATVKEYRPDVVLVDKHPFGASGEFRAGLKALRRQGGRAVLGLRDILDEPHQVLREWQPYGMQHRIAQYFDRVLIYGERAVFNPVEAYRFPPTLAGRIAFCGYVLNDECAAVLPEVPPPFPPRAERLRPMVLASAGGGEDGYQMLETFMRTAKGATWQGCVVAGPMTPAGELARLEQLAGESGVIFRAFVPHLARLFDSADALVCMGGYNTLTEAVAHGIPTVCIPRTVPRREQLLRAEAFASLGLLQVCLPSELHPAWLRQKIEVALAERRSGLCVRARTKLHFDGATRAGNHLLHLARASVDHEPADVLAVA